MDEYILLGLVAIIVLGILAQWLSWRLRISSGHRSRQSKKSKC